MEYLPLQAFAKINTNYTGGFCKWWYVPIEWLSGFSKIDPITQRLKFEPQLKTGFSWFGPIDIPDTEVGYEEASTKNIAGNYFKRKVTGFIPGNDIDAHINIQNTFNHQVCIVGKVRSGNFYLVLGNNINGLDFEASFTTGIGKVNTPGTKFIFSDESICRAIALATFSKDAGGVYIPPNAIKVPSGNYITTPNGGYIQTK